MIRSHRARACAAAGAFALLALGAPAARADALRLVPLAGLQTTLGRLDLNLYCQARPEGLEVVATASDGEAGTAIRFAAVLADGQSAVVSVPRGPGEPAEEIVLRRAGGRVEVVGAGLAAPRHLAAN
jgi:hypothetical protein